eukprot:13878351-Alexandrium_andersonii.AAC.1
MDLVPASAGGGRLLVDIIATHAVSSNADRLTRAALRDGAAAAAEEGHRRSKYWAAVGLVPFVFETGGRIGEATRAM